MINVGIVFGGQSPEHEVSVITSIQAAAVLDRKKYFPVPVYVAKSGLWYTGADMLDISAYTDVDALLARSRTLRLQPTGGSSLILQSISKGGLFGQSARDVRIDILFLGLHGGSGENGGMQGLSEALDIPYTGSGVLASSLAMDKARSKSFCSENGIPVVPFRTIRESQWADHEEERLQELELELGFPLVVKPVSLGSSIGISVVNSCDELENAVEEAFRYDETVIIEKAVEELREINCSVLGTEDSAVASVLEEPVSSDLLLSYEEKYMRGTASGSSKGQASSGAPSNAKSTSPGGMASLGRIIPAPLDAAKTKAIRELAVRIFTELGCAGVARIDFLMNATTGEIFFNEINTVPGSLSFYLWEPSGVSFQELVERLIEIGFERHSQRVHRIRSYDVNLLAERGAQGLKGSKE